MPKIERISWIFFTIVFLLNCAVWLQTRHMKAEWLNVPPVPSQYKVLSSSLGDKQLAYRSLSVMLQNLGDMGGRVTPINDYNFDRLAQWFYFMDDLDPVSDYIPYLAAFYFGSAHGDDAKDKLEPIAEYLYKIGNSPKGQKWRWLVHAIYLERFKVGNLERAYEMALDLSKIAEIERPDLPHWARQMPVFILNEKGDKKAALSMMLGILASKGEDIPAAEVNYTKFYVCEQILSPEEAKHFPLCQDK